MTDLKAKKTKRDHRRALKGLDALMDARPGTADADRLEVLAILIERYEREHFPIDPPSPIDAIRFRMEQMCYTQKDSAALLNSRSRASQILRGRTGGNLPLSTIRRLHAKWRIPSEVLIREARA
ncbi:MAG: helix-turn-helix domain-containing protein [Pseudomonadota bacterium]